MKKVLFLMVAVLALGLIFAGCGDMLNVTLPNGGNNLSRNGAGDIYGIERDSGIIWGIDPLSGITYQVFTVENAGKSNVGPNGLAYDGENGRFYYCEYQAANPTLYFWDGDENEAGTLVSGSGGAGVANADFDNGKYYYIYGTTDDLYEVTFSSDGTISTVDKIADIAGDNHGWTFDGDIAVQEGVVYGWGECVTSGHGFEFFTYNISTDTFNLHIPNYQASLQLAFGLDGNLYGHRSGNLGDIFVVDTDDGEVEKVSDTGGVLFTDLASAYMEVEEEPCYEFEGETAWAANDDIELEFRYTDRGNWATYVEYSEEGKTVILFAGQTEPVGSVTFSGPEEGEVEICIELNAPWEFEEVEENVKIQDYEEAPSGNPAPGLFDHKMTADVDNKCLSVPENNYYGVHVNVGQWIEVECPEEPE